MWLVSARTSSLKSCGLWHGCVRLEAW
jgi:hypothetical protein